MKVQWKGVYPALTTKFKEDFTIDYEAFLANVACQLSSGIDGIILGGTLGEASALMGNEKSALIKATKSFNKIDFVDKFKFEDLNLFLNNEIKEI